MKTKKPKLKRITKKEITEAFLKRPSTKISAMELSFFLKFYDLGVQDIIIKDGKMETAVFKKLEKSNLVEINTRQGVDRVSRTAIGNDFYKKYTSFRDSYATEKMGGVIDFSKKTPLTYENSTFKKTVEKAKKTVAKKEKSLATEIKENQNLILKNLDKKIMAKAPKKPRKKATAKPKAPKQTKAQIKAKMSAAGKKNYKGSKLEKINKLATELQEMSGTKQITVPKLSRKDATKRAANKISTGL